MSDLRISVTWKCERCDAAITAEHEYGESLHTPNGISWVRDDAGEHLLCEAHTAEWMREVEAKNPGVPWMA